MRAIAEHYGVEGVGVDVERQEAPKRPAWVNRLSAAEYRAYFEAFGFSVIDCAGVAPPKSSWRSNPRSSASRQSERGVC